MEKELNELIEKYGEGNMSLITLKTELLRLFAVRNSVCKCTCSNSLEYSNCNKNCERAEAERQTVL